MYTSSNTWACVCAGSVRRGGGASAAVVSSREQLCTRAAPTCPPRATHTPPTLQRHTPARPRPAGAPAPRRHTRASPHAASSAVGAGWRRARRRRPRWRACWGTCCCCGGRHLWRARWGGDTRLTRELSHGQGAPIPRSPASVPPCAVRVCNAQTHKHPPAPVGARCWLPMSPAGASASVVVGLVAPLPVRACRCDCMSRQVAWKEGEAARNRNRRLRVDSRPPPTQHAFQAVTRPHTASRWGGLAERGHRGATAQHNREKQRRGVRGRARAARGVGERGGKRVGGWDG